VVMSRHEFQDVWYLIRNPDRRIHLAVPEMLRELDSLAVETLDESATHPFILMAGERRSYNANQIFRNPAWRKGDKEGVMRMHPNDAVALGIEDAGRAIVQSARGQLEVTVELDDCVRPGVVTLPHGYGAFFEGRGPIGPAVNRLTAADHCDPLTRTPYHKYVPVRIVPTPVAAAL
jgi:anaerobic selenocysteine-containing dehydrogenase